MKNELKYGQDYQVKLGYAPNKKGVYIGRVYKRRPTESVYSFLFKNRLGNPEVYTGSYKNIKFNTNNSLEIKYPIKRSLNTFKKKACKRIYV